MMKRDNKPMAILTIIGMLLLLAFVIWVEIHSFSVPLLLLGVLAVVIIFRQVNRLRVMKEAAEDECDDEDNNFYWDQVSNMVVAGLMFVIVIQNDDVAGTMFRSLVTTLQTTLTGYLTGRFT